MEYASSDRSGHGEGGSEGFPAEAHRGDRGPGIRPGRQWRYIKDALDHLIHREFRGGSPESTVAEAPLGNLDEGVRGDAGWPPTQQRTSASAVRRPYALRGP